MYLMLDVTVLNYVTLLGHTYILKMTTKGTKTRKKRKKSCQYDERKKKLLVVGESKQLCWLKQIKPLPAEYTAYTST